MRVAVYSGPYHPVLGGVSVTTELLARALGRIGHAVTVVTETMGRDEAASPDIDVVRTRNPLRALAVFRRADLIVVKGGVSLKAGLLALLSGRPYVVVHEMSWPYRRPEPRGPVDPDRFLRWLVVTRAAEHVCVSAACLASKGLPEGCRTRVIYNPVDPALAESRVDGVATEHDLLFVGRVIRSKGIGVLADALDRIEGLGDVRRTVLVVGEGEDEGLLRDRAGAWRNVEVRFAGPLRGADLARAYRASRLVVVPSTSPEGMGLVIAEAFRFGRPVLGSSDPAITEVVGDGGRITPIGDAGALAGVIEAVLRDAALYDDLSARAAARARLFAFDAFVAGWRDLTERLRPSARP